MVDYVPVRKLQDRICSRNAWLIENHTDPLNSDRALCGEFAVVNFASVTGQSTDVQVDPETVLGDLLADLMHWCDTQKHNRLVKESIDFMSALRRARNHYNEECADELSAHDEDATCE